MKVKKKMLLVHYLNGPLMYSHKKQHDVYNKTSQLKGKQVLHYINSLKDKIINKIYLNTHG